MSEAVSCTRSIIVAYDYRALDDQAILLVGTKVPEHDVQVIKTFEGQEAKDIWSKLYPDTPEFAK